MAWGPSLLLSQEKAQKSEIENLGADMLNNADYLDIDDKFFKLNSGQNLSRIIEFKGNYYAVGVKCSSGYREYKSHEDDYKNDVLAFVFVECGDITDNIPINEIKDTKTLLSTEEQKFVDEP